MRKQDGFSLVELMVVLVVFIFVITAATGMFIPLVGQFKQQSKIAETNIERIVGIELLRGDLDQAGFGLPWYFQYETTIAYAEAAGAPQSLYNDAPANPPRPIVAGNNVVLANIVNGSDYLVIKSALVTASDTAASDTPRKWTYIVTENEPNPKSWTPSVSVPNPNLAPTDRVIVIMPKVGDTRLRVLAMAPDQTTFSTLYNASFPANFSPTKPTDMFVIYGISNLPAALKMPFNRADYYLGIPNGTAQFPGTLPARCAPGTGVLMKAVLSQAAGVDFPTPNVIPLLDCVADMQVIFGLDLNQNGLVGTYTNPNGTTIVQAQPLTGVPDDESLKWADVPGMLQAHTDLFDYRSSLQEVRVYILAQEGQRDPSYTFTGFTGTATCPTCMRVGDINLAGTLGRDFDLSAIPNYQNYRWKVYSMVVKPQNINMK